MQERITRREGLLRCFAVGGLRLVPGLALADAITRVEAHERARASPVTSPTPWNDIGPFYKRKAPGNPQLRAPNDPGLPVAVSGRVLDTRGRPIGQAILQVWQADHRGVYDLDGYRYRATLTTDSEGRYAFQSVMPGHYPARVCQHIHYEVTAPGHAPLVTQLYFATDPAFEGDPDRNYTRDPYLRFPELIRPVTLSGDPNEIQANVKFELVLGRS